MGLAEDLTAIGEKIDEVTAAHENVSVAFNFNPIPAGNDYSVTVAMPNGVPARFSSLDATEVTDFLDGIIAAL